MTFVGIEGGVANEKTCPYEGSRFERSRRSQIPDPRHSNYPLRYPLQFVDGRRALFVASGSSTPHKPGFNSHCQHPSLAILGLYPQNFNLLPITFSLSV